MAKGENPWMEFLQGDAQRLPFRPGSFDLIVAFEVFEHLPRPAGFLIDSWKTLKHDGVLVLTAASRTILGMLYDLLRGEKTHANLLKPHEARRIFERAFDKVFVINSLLLPIPPHLLNKYFVIYNAPNHLETGYVLVAWDKKKASLFLNGSPSAEDRIPFLCKGLLERE